MSDDIVIIEENSRVDVTEQQGIDIIAGGPRGPAGPQGPQGPPGPAGGTTYTHNQSVPSATWTITHNLGRFPSVTVVDSAGTACWGEVQYVDENTVHVFFSAAFGGVAYLN